MSIARRRLTQSLLAQSLLALPLAATLARAAPAFRPGATIAFTPPPGYTRDAAASFIDRSVFRGPQDARLSLVELYTDDETVRTTLIEGSLANFKAGGLAEAARHTVTIAGQPATLVQMDKIGHPPVTVWYCVFSGTGRAYVMTALCPGPIRDRDQEAMIKAFLGGIALRPPPDLAPLRDALPYQFGDVNGLPLVAIEGTEALMAVTARLIRLQMVLKPTGWAKPSDKPADLARRIIAAEIPLPLTVYSAEPPQSHAFAGQEGSEIRASLGGTPGHPALRVFAALAAAPKGGTMALVGHAPPEAFDAALPAFQWVRDGLTLR